MVNYRILGQSNRGRYLGCGVVGKRLWQFSGVWGGGQIRKRDAAIFSRLFTAYGIVML